MNDSITNYKPNLVLDPKKTYSIQPGVRAIKTGAECSPISLKKGYIDSLLINKDLPFDGTKEIFINVSHGQKVNFNTTNGSGGMGSSNTIWHAGYDLITTTTKEESPQGVPVYAVHKGKIIHYGFSKKIKNGEKDENFGFYILIETPIGKNTKGENISLYTIYAHGKEIRPDDIDYDFQLNQFKDKKDISTLFERALRMVFPKFDYRELSSLQQLLSNQEKLDKLNGLLVYNTERNLEKRIFQLNAEYQKSYGFESSDSTYWGKLSGDKLYSFVPELETRYSDLPIFNRTNGGMNKPMAFEFLPEAEKIIRETKWLSSESRKYLLEMRAQSEMLKKLNPLLQNMYQFSIEEAHQSKTKLLTLHKARREALEILLPNECPLNLGKLQEGVEINKKQNILFVGNSGKSTGPHLHMQTRIDRSGLTVKEYFETDQKFLDALSNSSSEETINFKPEHCEK